jgi:hypothetical protein
MEDGVHGHAESGIAVVAVVALLGGSRRGTIGLAVGTRRSAVPADLFEVRYAIGFCRELSVYLDDVHCGPPSSFRVTTVYHKARKKSTTVNWYIPK